MDKVTYDELLSSLLSVEKLLRVNIYPNSFRQVLRSLLDDLSKASVQLPYREPSQAIINSVKELTRIVQANNQILVRVVISTKQGLKDL